MVDRVANRFQIASAITPSSYVSYHTAFEYYGIADQVFYEVFVGSETRATILNLMGTPIIMLRGRCKME